MHASGGSGMYVYVYAHLADNSAVDLHKALYNWSNI